MGDGIVGPDEDEDPELALDAAAAFGAAVRFRVRPRFGLGASPSTGTPSAAAKASMKSSVRTWSAGGGSGIDHTRKSMTSSGKKPFWNHQVS